MKTNPDPSSSPRLQRVFKLVQRGYAVHVQALQLADQLHIIEGMLKAESLLRPFDYWPVDDADPGTTQWVARGPGC